MGMFDFITNNENFKKIMLGQLQKIFDDGKVTAILVTKNEEKDMLDITLLEPGDILKDNSSDESIKAIGYFPDDCKVILLTQRISGNANVINTNDATLNDGNAPK